MAPDRETHFSKEDATPQAENNWPSITVPYRELELTTYASSVRKRPISETRFLVRSALGRELRKMVCYFPGRTCGDCPLVETCAYGALFHTAEGRQNRTTHPFVLSVRQHSTTENRLVVTLRLFGACARYLAYVYYALVRASHTGLSRRRGFRIERVRVDGRNVAADEESFSVPETSLSLCFPASTRVRAPYRVHLTTHSPLRVKARGEFLNSLDWKELWIAATRRVSRVADRFCDTGARIDWIEALREVPTVLEEDGAFDWIDARYRSRPQERVLKLGGIVGTLDARVLMSPLEREVAKSLEILHLGKNTTFGLGEVAVAISATGEAHEQ